MRQRPPPRIWLSPHHFHGKARLCPALATTRTTPRSTSQHQPLVPVCLSLSYSLTQALPQKPVELLVRALLRHYLDEVFVRQLLCRRLSLPADHEVSIQVDVIVGDEGEGPGAVERGLGGRGGARTGALLWRIASTTFPVVGRGGRDRRGGLSSA